MDDLATPGGEHVIFELPEAPVPVDAAALHAALAAFWANPEPGMFSFEVPERIAGGKDDQPVPDGIQNPYWEIIRQLPLSDMRLPWATGLEVTLRHFTSGPRGVRYFADFNALRRTYSWSIPSPGDITWMKDVLVGRCVVELGAGGGYWAWQLRQAGVDVVAYDPAEPGDNWYACQEWTAVQRGDHTAVAAHPDRALFMCWPSNGKPWAAEALDAYEGDLLIYAAAGEYCADEAFREAIEAGWEPVSASLDHVSYDHTPCILSAWHRKGT